MVFIACMVFFCVCVILKGKCKSPSVQERSGNVGMIGWWGDIKLHGVLCSELPSFDVHMSQVCPSQLAPYFFAPEALR